MHAEDGNNDVADADIDKLIHCQPRTDDAYTNIDPRSTRRIAATFTRIRDNIQLGKKKRNRWTHLMSHFFTKILLHEEKSKIGKKLDEIKSRCKIVPSS